jgi:hypothetical protein
MNATELTSGNTKVCMPKTTCAPRPAPRPFGLSSPCVKTGPC